MNDLLKTLVIEIEENRKNISPVKQAWLNSCQRIGLNVDDPFVQFGLKFADHPDLVYSSNKYHNHLHTSDVIISASFLAKEEFNNKDLNYSGPLLLFSMMCHDIAHNGGHNTFDYELERAAVNSMNNYVNSNNELLQYWNNNLKEKFGEWSEFSEKVESVILGTDFKNGPTVNLKNYQESAIDLNKVKLLANEADVLPSCTSYLGPNLSIGLAEEQNSPNLSSWRSREFFIKNLVKFGSDASKKIGIQKHIDKQLQIINSLGVEELDKDSLNGNFQTIASRIHEEANKKIPALNLDELRAKYLNNNNKNQYRI